MAWFTVKQAKRYGVASCPPDESLWDAAAHMAEEGISSLIVRDAAGVMVGIITRTDLLRAHIQHANWKVTPVSGYMNREVICVTPGNSLEQAINVILQERIDRVVVVDNHDDRRPLAVVSTWDLVNILMNERY